MPDYAVLYARKSDPSSHENDPAFEQQEAACEAYAAKMGYTVVERIRESWSGADLVRQEGLWRAIDAVRHGRANVVVAYSYDRLSRDLQSQEVALWEIEHKYGGRFEAATEQIDRNDPMRAMLRSVMGMASQVERGRVVQRLQRGRLDRARGNGTRLPALNGSPTPKYGYTWKDPVPGGHTTYEIEEATAAIVRRIFQWADHGYGMRPIARRLNDEHEPTPGQWATDHGYPRYDKKTGALVAVGTEWKHEMVRRILQDPAYCGRMTAYTQEVMHTYVKNGNTGIMEKHATRRMRQEGAIALPETTCPAIVSVELWDRVQAGVASRVKEGRPPLDENATLFRGHVYCACGTKMSMSRVTEDGSYVYSCLHRAGTITGQRHCPYGHQSIRARVVNEAGEAALQFLLQHREDVARIVEARMAETVDTTLERVAANLEEMVARKRADWEKYRTAIAAAKDPTTIAALAENMDKLAADIRADEAELAKNRGQLSGLEARRGQFTRVLARLNAYPVQYVGQELPMTNEDKRFLMDLVGLHLEVYPVGQEVDGSRVVAKCEVRGELVSVTTSFIVVPMPLGPM
jgi:DNA invertase Pin-like site-specific DNA recombinase